MVYFIRFFHLLCVLGILAITIYCIIGIPWRKPNIRWLWALLALGGGAMLTGTLLVSFTRFDFTTPWIDAAYILTTTVLIGFSILFWLHKRYPTTSSIRWSCVSAVLLLVLVGVIYDAILKTTFLFG